MSLLDLYLEYPPQPFAGINRRLGDSVYAVFGVPFDSTASYRVGQRFAPQAVREASLNIESNGYAIEGYIEDVPVADIGDLAVVHGNARETIDRVAAIVAELASMGKKPVVLGGEHTVTLGIMRGYAKAGLKPCLVILDAHFDLRDDYLGEKLSHATWLRRALELLGVKAFLVAVRAYDRSEVSYAQASSLIDYVASWNVEVMGVKVVALRAKQFLGECGSVHLSIDMDFYDPSYAPGVGTPEPGGLGTREGLLLLTEIASSMDIVGIDLVEMTPNYDVAGATQVLAAKTLQQALIAAWNREVTRVHS